VLSEISLQGFNTVDNAVVFTIAMVQTLTLNPIAQSPKSLVRKLRGLPRIVFLGFDTVEFAVV
jgi:hypothetical protein